MFSWVNLWKCEGEYRHIHVISEFETNLESWHLRLINISHFFTASASFSFPLFLMPLWGDINKVQLFSCWAIYAVNFQITKSYSRWKFQRECYCRRAGIWGFQTVIKYGKSLKSRKQWIESDDWTPADLWSFFASPKGILFVRGK